VACRLHVFSQIDPFVLFSVASYFNTRFPECSLLSSTYQLSSLDISFIPKFVTMGPVSVTLLATLLPAGFLIISLLFLSGYLTFQLRASHALAKKAEDEITVSEPPANPRPFFVENRDVTKRLYSLSDAADPTWRSDAIQALINIENIGIDRYCVHVSKYCEPGDEEWAAELLAQLGYTGGLSVPAIFCLLKQWETYRCVMHHILDDVVLKHLSLDGDPEDSLLPFTAEQHRGLRDFYKALEMKKCKVYLTQHPAYVANSQQCPRILRF
jgi:hypothetical protein